jgi:N-acetylmuramoyl-L-alanine amidase
MEVSLTTPGPQSSNQNVEDKTEKHEYTKDELYWLSRIIEAEAGGESFKGKLAVGNVVLNRVKDARFPSTIYGVIFDCSTGVYQFSPVANGTVYNTPSADSVEAAKQCLEGKNVVGNALFFMNGAIAETAWIAYNRPYIMTIGNHQFYA